jgi:hypothetical protein
MEMQNKKQARTTSKKTKVIGKQEYINSQTGEIEEFNVVSIEDRDCNFSKIWIGHIISALDAVGNQKIKVITFILDNMWKQNNLLLMTQREIADKSGVSLQTVNETIRILQEAAFLKGKTGAYMINPDVLFKGSFNSRMNILLKYYDIGIEDKLKKEAERFARKDEKEK